MGFLDRLFGRKEQPDRADAGYARADFGRRGQSPSDEQAIERYRYMVRTAPPEVVEQAHEEAFARLTPAQRAQVLRELAAVTPEGERAAVAAGQDDPRTLARLATRAEMRQPGTLERTLGGPSMGSMMAGTIFGSLVAGFVGSMIANQFFDSVGGFDAAEGGHAEHADSAAADHYADGGDFGGDFGGDM